MSAEVVVLGAGIAGASAAYRLALSGAQVTLVDGGADGQATPAGAGIICIGSSAMHDGAAFSLSKESAAYYPTLLEQLAADGERNTRYDVTGVLHVALDESEAEQLPGMVADIEARQAAGLTGLGDVTMVSGDEAQEMFPLLRNIVAAVHIAGAARVDGGSLRDALHRAGVKHGVRIVHGEGTVVYVDGRASGVSVNGSLIAADAVIVAAGAWTAGVAESLGRVVPVFPQRGQSIHTRIPGIRTGGWPIVMGFRSHYLVTFPDDEVVVGATRESTSGFDYRSTVAGVLGELDAAVQIAPDMANASFVGVQVGFRPFSPDGLPIMGRFAGYDNVYVCTGHGPIGLQLAPYSGAAIADMVLGKAITADLSQLGPERFQ